ncbi:type II toxin-antitoxin system RelE/ParE family toxin [Arthrobacter bambusae]|nr:type II toxin-antitoxin system RelE/ParE family toxin [Arthrobacter bambusae]
MRAPPGDITLELYTLWVVSWALVWNVDLDFVEPWLLGLDQDSYEQVIAALELLAERGPHLGRPLVDTVVRSRHKNMKELRPGSSGRSELRILFAFDPERHAILLVAGDKAGNWSKWYKTNIPIADDLFDDHLRILKGGS